nr:hypothetical protein B1D4.240 [imported] - Neurospora crassa [Neurospora crassa]
MINARVKLRGHRQLALKAGRLASLATCQTAVHSLIPINVAASAQDVPIMTALAAPSSLAVTRGDGVRAERFPPSNFVTPRIAIIECDNTAVLCRASVDALRSVAIVCDTLPKPHRGIGMQSNARGVVFRGEKHSLEHPQGRGPKQVQRAARPILIRQPNSSESHAVDPGARPKSFRYKIENSPSFAVGREETVMPGLEIGTAPVRGAIPLGSGLCTVDVVDSSTALPLQLPSWKRLRQGHAGRCPQEPEIGSTEHCSELGTYVVAKLESRGLYEVPSHNLRVTHVLFPCKGSSSDTPLCNEISGQSVANLDKPGGGQFWAFGHRPVPTILLGGVSPGSDP